MGKSSGALDCDSAAGSPSSTVPSTRTVLPHLARVHSFRRLVLLTLSIVLLVVTSPARAGGDTLAKVRQSGRLTYGSDKEGGGPYAFPDPKSPRDVVGFEVELMNGLARSLGAAAGFS